MSSKKIGNTKKNTRRSSLGKRNSSEGKRWERECINKLKPFFPHVVSSRSESRSTDSKKVDLMNKDEYKYGKLPYEIQCKSYVKRIEYDLLLSLMPNKNPPIILHKQTERRGSRFYETGRYAIMHMDTFLELLKAARSK